MERQRPIQQAPKKLGQWLSTAICGNDITSSCLYVSAIAAVYVGALAPLVLLLVALLLYLYRKVYTEVVEALPLNGGAYNCLLNSTSKYSAAIAACLTLLSYITTAVISGTSAVSYLHSLLPFFEPVPVAILVLLVFAVLTILGIGESAIVALCIFVLHLCTLTALCLFSLPQMIAGFGTFITNWSFVPGNGHDLLVALFLGFSVALLGISGFESSANFVEEQKPGVFRKTLRNMWTAVFIFNPLISLISLNLLPLKTILQKQDFLLAHMGRVLGGGVLQTIVVVDAFMVLCGAVLTAYVGVTGLVQRMTLDQVLPQFLLKQNRARGTYHRIILTFFFLCTSILLLTGGDILALAGVYTISFLGVMSLFALGNMLLKVNRKELKRTFRAGWITVMAAFVATVAGIAGNIIHQPRYFLYFLAYFIPTMAVITIVYMRLKILKIIVHLGNRAMDKLFIWRSMVVDRIMDITRQQVLVFSRGGNLPKLRRAFDYIIKNEDSHKVFVVYLKTSQDDTQVEEKLRHDLEVLARTYPELDIELISREGTFGPETVQKFSEELNIPINNMFIGAPEEKHNFTIQDLGGVRVIF